MDQTGPTFEILGACWRGGGGEQPVAQRGARPVAFLLR
jgi:hypothetical protein